FARGLVMVGVGVPPVLVALGAGVGLAARLAISVEAGVLAAAILAQESGWLACLATAPIFRSSRLVLVAVSSTRSVRRLMMSSSCWFSCLRCSTWLRRVSMWLSRGSREGATNVFLVKSN